MKPLCKPELEHLVGKIKADLSNKQDKLTAGNNITITNNTISATDTVNDIQARREILDIKLKLDEMQIVDYLNKTGIGFYDLFTDVDNIDMINTTATINTSEAEVLFDGLELLKMKEQQFDNFNNLELAIYDKDREFINTIEDSANNQIEVLITPGSINVGDKYVYNNAIYTVSTVSNG